jgi:tetratricopeptide (TPR) repeat protein
MTDPLHTSYPDITPSGLSCDNKQLLKMCYDAVSAIDNRDFPQAEAMLDKLLEAYPSCIWSYELYDRYLVRGHNKYEPESSHLSTEFVQQESIRNFEKILELNPSDEICVYFAAEYSSIRYALARSYDKVVWDAESFDEFQHAAAACIRHLDVWLENQKAQDQLIRAQGGEGNIEFIESEYKAIRQHCEAILKAWTLSNGNKPSDELVAELMYGDLSERYGDLDDEDE